MKKIKLVTLTTLIISLCLSFCLNTEAVGNNRPSKMAKNIYMDPVTSGKDTSGEYQAFQIDFLGGATPVNTYWALCNWEMKGGFGAYGGLQNTVDGRMAIMSFWEGQKDGRLLRAKRMYPAGNESYFGGEGEGTHWITPYNWASGQWYRMLFFCWDDVATGHTFVGQWVEDLTTGQWTLISYYDTNLTDSAIMGGLSQFQENFVPGTDYPVRNFAVKNIYAYDKINKVWISLDKSQISTDPSSWGFNTAGTYEFGSNGQFFWGQSGEYVADQKSYNASHPVSKTFEIDQPDQPETPASQLVAMTASYANGKTQVSWKASNLATPIYRYDIGLMDAAGNIVEVATYTRPELETALLQTPYSASLKPIMVTTDVYGNKQKYGF